MHDRIRANRHVCAALWGVIFVLAFMGIVLEAAQPASFAVIGSLLIALVTFALGKFEPEESLARPLVYRAIVGAWLAVTLAGAALALVPESSEASRFFGVYFGVVSVLAYRAVVARGPRRAVSAAVISVLLWFPLVLFLARQNTGHEHPPQANWTEDATFVILQVFVLMLPVIAIAALVTFVPREDQVPSARVVRDNR